MRLFKSLVENPLKSPLFLQFLAAVLTKVHAVHIGEGHAQFVPRAVLAGNMGRFEHIGGTDFTSFELLLACGLTLSL